MTASIDRDAILRRFETLLDSALAAEAPPAGIDAEILSAVAAGETAEDRRCDSYALWGAITALTQEIKLQGRAFQELNLTLAAQAAERERNAQREAERRCRKEALGALIDLRDRLERGLESACARRGERAAALPPGWWAETFGKRLLAERASESASVDALVRGYELGIERLDQALAESSAIEIRCLGESFDPRRMNAVDSEETGTVPAGTVLEVYRGGYEWNGEVFRPAQVKVSRGGLWRKDE